MPRMLKTKITKRTPCKNYLMLDLKVEQLKYFAETNISP